MVVSEKHGTTTLQPHALRHLLLAIADRAGSLGAHSDLVLRSLPEALVSHVMALSAGLGITLDTAELIRVAANPTVTEMRSAGKSGANASTPTEKESS